MCVYKMLAEEDQEGCFSGDLIIDIFILWLCRYLEKGYSGLH